MERSDRIKLIEKIEEERDSHLITYILGDREPTSARVAPDAIRPLADHLRLHLNRNPKRDRVDLFIYGRGGDAVVPWPLVTMFREFSKEFNVIIPYRAYSALTMVALGADNIIIGKKGELSPIDPTISAQPGAGTTTPISEIRTEDVSSYITFMKERAGLSDQSALASAIAILANNLGPLNLGSVQRAQSHIRLVAKKLLTSRMAKIEDERVGIIIEWLTEKIYSHGHAIGRKEASELGLQIQKPPENIEELIWSLYEQYENLLQFRNPIDVRATLEDANNDELELQNLIIGFIESVPRSDAFKMNFRIKGVRVTPPNVNLNLNVQFPPQINPENWNAQAQQLFQQLMQVISENVRKQIAGVAPMKDIITYSRHPSWQEITKEGI
ncbi:MAG: SDH family Clp fold serine proteinase [Desulfobacteraceae bacterium]